MQPDECLRPGTQIQAHTFLDNAFSRDCKLFFVRCGIAWRHAQEVSTAVLIKRVLIAIYNMLNFLNYLPQETILAKSQKKSNREAKKPKQDKKPAPVVTAAVVPSSARKK